MKKELPMIPRNHQNRKAYVDLSCPGCGMALDDPKIEGFVLNNQTYCCQGCAEGTGCTCTSVRIKPKKGGQKPGHMGQRNPENSVRDRNFNQEINTSGEIIGRRRETAKAPSRYATRVPRVTEPPKTKRALTKQRDSTREQARGRSEFVNRRSGSPNTDRVSTTGSKGRNSTGR
jgi:hypothetical protein